MKRLSVETADFIQFQNDKKSAQTIEYDSYNLIDRQPNDGQMSPVINGYDRKKANNNAV